MKIKVNRKELAMIVDALASVNGMDYKTEKQRGTFYNLFGRLAAIADTPKRINFSEDCYAERVLSGWIAVYKGEILGNSDEPRTFEIAKENCLTALEGERVKACDVIWGNCPQSGQYHTP